MSYPFNVKFEPNDINDESKGYRLIFPKNNENSFLTGLYIEYDRDHKGMYRLLKDRNPPLQYIYKTKNAEIEIMMKNQYISPMMILADLYNLISLDD